jgi:hypothetical protein
LKGELLPVTFNKKEASGNLVEYLKD